ncbi:hypothetical protein Cgig2_023574 [Carnegiea gigantea]|uniref:Uncharacterized protein n=1 Tax=Carnegiea gigantea TaxID=171969 RepID=A0A9Q1GKZ0_9CARY|nr:hypothetical protein Cgig2_023574 [Carnegiea gigantea]
MAVDVYSENMVGIVSPRISFSQDLEENDDDLLTSNNNNPIPCCRLDSTPLDSAAFDFDFAFNVDTTTFFRSSTADELFSNGRILPTGVKKEEETTVKRAPEIPCLDPQPSPATEPKKKSLKEFLEDSIEEEEEEEEPNTSPKSFWKFRRSNSLNFDKKRLIGSWKILSRSGSTGKFLQKIVEEDEAEKPVTLKSFRKFNTSPSLNSAIVNGNANTEQFRRSSSLNCTISGANQGLSGSVKNLPRSKSTGSAPNQVGNQNKGKSSSQKGQIKNLKIYGHGNGNSNKNSMRYLIVIFQYNK